MFVRGSSLVGLLLLTAAWLSLSAASAEAQTPWRNMQLFKKIEVDPNKAFAVTDAQGPWMIMCITFEGEEADKHAKELVHELRSAHKLPAFTHRMTFDYTEGTTGRGVDRFGQPRKMKYKSEKVDEVAVLIGDFTGVEDPQARKILEKIKYMQPDCLNPEKLIKDGKKTSSTMGAFRQVVKNMLPDGHEDKQKGPMRHAFVTGNPIIPREYFVPKGIDKLVYEMNKPLPNSLLNCPGKYTVKVATFTGKVVIDPAAIKEIEAGKKAPPSGLAEAAEKAHLMCEALRAKGYNAFEFHDRHASIVTVGSFDSVGTPRADGKIEIDPRVHATIENFSAPIVNQPGGAVSRGDARKIVNLAFDSQALPVEVPQTGLIVDYDRTAASKR